MGTPLQGSFDVAKHNCVGGRAMWECTFSTYNGASKTFHTDPIRLLAMDYHVSVDQGWTLHLIQTNETYNTSIDYLLPVGLMDALSTSAGWTHLTGPYFSAAAVSNNGVPCGAIIAGLVTLGMSTAAANSGQGGVVRFFGTTEF